MVDIQNEKVANREQMAAYVNEMIKKDPKNPELYLKMAELYLALNKMDAAGEAVEKYKALKGTDPEADFLEAKIAYKLGNRQRALTNAEALFLDGYESIELHELLFQLYYETRESLKAIDQINYAIEMNPANHEYYYNKAICYMQNRDTVNALVSLESAIHDGYDSINAITQYVDLLVAVNDQEKAIRVINQGLSVDPDNPDINTGYARLLKNQKQFRKAKDILFDILKEDKNNYKACAALSEVYLDTYSYDSVLYYANKAIQLNENYFLPYYTKAKVFARKQNYYSALNIYEQVLDKDPENPIALYESDKLRNYLSYLQRITEEYNNRPVVPLLKPKSIEN
jgi:tetratricopeptide (TPR) repeat protein